MGGSYLDGLESKSIYMIREAYWRYKDKLAVLWSMGKDSTVLVHLMRKAFFGKVPVPAVHLDTSFKFKEIYDFRDRISQEWGLNLIVSKNNLALKKAMNPRKGRFDCCNALKTDALKQVIKKYGFSALMLAIRRDEHFIRAKERYFSARKEDFKWDYQNQPVELWAQYYKDLKGADKHLRIHPLLHWQEIDIWRYIAQENLPVVRLYFSQSGKRYRSIGCKCCCLPHSSSADSLGKIIKEIRESKTAERSGRVQDKEKQYMMQKLRSLGYM